MNEGLDLYDDVLTTSGPAEDEALQSHVCKSDFKNKHAAVQCYKICLLTLSYVVSFCFPSRIYLLLKISIHI